NTPTGCAISPLAPPSGTAACPGGIAELAGTGFEDPGQYCGPDPLHYVDSTGGGATGRLTSSAPVQPSATITLEFLTLATGHQRSRSSLMGGIVAVGPNPLETGAVRPPPR